MLKDAFAYGGMMISYLQSIFMTSYILGTHSRIPVDTREVIYMLFWLIPLRTFSLAL